MMLSEIYSGLIAGGMLFFAFFMAPLVFTQLAPQSSGPFIRAVFPWYYIVFSVLFVTLAILLFVSSLTNLALIAFISGITFIVARQSLMPLINKFSDLSAAGDPVAGKKFKKLHRVSVVINTIQMLAILFIFYTLASYTS